MWRQALVGSVLLVTLYGCTTVNLPSTIQLHGWTPATNPAGDPIPAGGGNDFLHAASPDSEGDKSNPIGLHLVPGDVIYLRRWSPGLSNPDDPVINYVSPIATVDRIPLRLIGKEGHLYDYEREFLTNVLVTNRSSMFTALGIQLSDGLLSNETALWNALAHSLILKRFTGTKSEQNLMLVVRMPDLLAALPEKPNNLRTAFLGAPTQGQLGPGERPDRDFEITSINVPVDSPYHTFGVTLDENGHYYSQAFSLPRFNFLSVDLSGVQMSHPGREEAQWTLRDWEDSGICHAIDSANVRYPAAIQWVQLKTSRLTFHIQPERATHRVKTVITRDMHKRSLEATPHFTWGIAKISEKDLANLTVYDVRQIRWTADNHDLPLSDNCQIP